MGKKTTVAFRIDEDVKSEWEEAAEAPEYESLSHLIRLSVQREIASEGRQTAREGGQSKASGEVLQHLNRLEGAVDEIHDELEALGREDRAEELYDLEQVLLEILPTASATLEPTTDLEADTLKAEAATPGELSARIGARTGDVADALERLTDTTAQVRDATHRNTDETYYWRAE